MSGAYATVVAAAVIYVLFLRGGGWAQRWEFPPTARWLTAGVFSAMTLVMVLQLVFANRARQTGFRNSSQLPTAPETYLACGVLPPEVSAGPIKLYLDLVRRSVANLIYEDRPAWVITPDREYKIVDSFDLGARLVGRDQPTEALSMVGWKRLEQLQNCIEQVVLLKGFFADTIPTAPIKNLAVVRLDGDTYESTNDALNLTYAKLSPGGYCIIDDYEYFSECKRAVDEFRTAHGIEETVEPIDGCGVYWRKRI